MARTQERRQLLSQIPPLDILLVSADSPDRRLVARTLSSHGHKVFVAETRTAALSHLSRTQPNLVILDLEAKEEALKLLRSLKAQKAPWPVVVISTAVRSDLASNALNLGATDLVSRPLKPDELLESVANAVEFSRVAGNAVEPVDTDQPGPIFGSSSIMQGVLNIVRRVALIRCSVLVLGERGTGRDMVARAIHALGRNPSQPFVKLECNDVKLKDFDSELVSAVAAADESRSRTDNGGRTEGTLYLRDVGQLAVSVQQRLERMLTPRGIVVVPHAQGAPLKLRVVASGLPELPEAVEQGQFRQDLLERLATIRIDLPPLRYRAQDIPLLATHFLKEACRQHEMPLKTFTRSALSLLSVLPWHGNAQELRTLTERLAVLVPRGVVLQEDVLEHVRFEGAEIRGPARGSLRMARMRFERDHVMAVLRHHHGRMGAAAKELGIERTNLYRKIKHLGIKMDLRRG